MNEVGVVGLGHPLFVPLKQNVFVQVSSSKLALKHKKQGPITALPAIKAREWQYLNNLPVRVLGCRRMGGGSKLIVGNHAFCFDV